MARGGIHKVIAGNRDSFPGSNIPQALPEQLEVERFLSLGEDSFFLAVLPVGEEIIQLDRGGFLSSPVKVGTQALHDLRFSGGSWPRNGKQDRCTARCDKLADTLHECLVHFGIRLPERLV